MSISDKIFYQNCICKVSERTIELVKIRHNLATFPGAIKTNVATNSMFLPKKLREQQQKGISFFAEMTKSIMDKFVSAVTNGSSPKAVADIILKVAMTEEPQWKYLAGADAESLFKTKKVFRLSEVSNGKKRFLQQI